MNVRLLIVTASGALTLLAGCGPVADPDGEGATVVEEAAPRTPAQADQPAPALGTRENPVPAETSFEVTNWVVELGETDTDATETIMAENQFNEIAGSRVAVMVEVEATYTGPDSGTPWIDLTTSFHTAAGNTYGTGADDYCGVVPNDLMDLGEMFTDASGSGNVCVAIPADEVEGGSWIVELLFSFDPERVFVALT